MAARGVILLTFHSTARVSFAPFHVLTRRAFATFVGLYPIPVRHGMTVGELAIMINESGWLSNGIRANLTVIPLAGWHRDMWYDQTGLDWRAPSPNMPDLQVATVYLYHMS